MKMLTIILLIFAGVSCMDEFNSITIKNTNKRNLIPIYNKQNLLVNVALAPTPISAGKTSTLRSIDSSEFGLSTMYTDEHNLFTISFLLVIGYKNNQFQVKTTGNGYTYTYQMNCGDASANNQVVKLGKPCHIQLTLADIDDGIQTRKTSQKGKNYTLFYNYGQKPSNIIDNNIVMTDFGQMNNVKCILNVYDKGNLICKEPILNTINFVENGFAGVNYQIKQGIKIPYEKITQEYFQFRIWSSEKNNLHINMTGIASKCLKKAITCEGLVISNGPNVKSSIQLANAYIGNGMFTCPSATIKAKGKNVDSFSKFAYLQVVNQGNRYITLQGGQQIQFTINKVQNCVDNSAQHMYFSQIDVKPGDPVNFQMEDQPSGPICKHMCYYDASRNTSYNNVIGLTARDKFSAYVLRITSQDSQTPLQQTNWGYTLQADVITVNSIKRWQINLNQSSNHNETIFPQDIPQWIGGCLEKRVNNDKIRCEDVEVPGQGWKNCWVPVVKEKKIRSLNKNNLIANDP